MKINNLPLSTAISGILAALLLLSGCSTTTVRQNAAFADGLDYPRVAVLSPEIEIKELQFNGDALPLEEEQESARLAIEYLITQRLNEKGYDVNWVSPETLAEHAYEVQQVRESCSAQMEELYKVLPMDTKKALAITAALDPSAVAAVGTLENCDALVLIHYGGFRKSSGQKAKEVTASVLVSVATLGMVIPIPIMQGSYADVVIVDADNGNVLWSNALPGGAINAEGDLERVLAALPNRPMVTAVAPPEPADLDDAMAAPSPFEATTEPIPTADAPTTAPEPMPPPL